MTAESRKAIPGRAQAEPQSIDRLVFGDGEPRLKEDPQEKEIRVRLREHAAAANDDQDDEKPADPTAPGEINFVERAAQDRRRSNDRRRAYSRLPDERGNFGAENSRRGPFLALIAIAVTLVFGALVWNMYRDGVKSSTTAIKPKAIAGGSFKSKPESEDSAEIESAQVFEQSSSPAVAADPAPSEILPGSAAEAPPPKTEPSSAPSAPPSAAASPVEEARASPAPVVPAPKPSIAPAPKAAAPKPSPSPVAATVPKPAAPAPGFARDGRYVVQLAALASESEADAEWARRTRFAPELFASTEKIVVKAEVNGKTVYRLRVGSFVQAADADAFCNAYKARGGVCFRAMK